VAELVRVQGQLGELVAELVVELAIVRDQLGELARV